MALAIETDEVIPDTFLILAYPVKHSRPFILS